jgi:hypothetical protein
MFQQPTRYHIPKDSNVDSMSRKINYKMYVTSDSTLPKLPGLRITIKFSVKMAVLGLIFEEGARRIRSRRITKIAT